MLKVINNYLNNEHFTNINEQITANDFPWYNNFNERHFVHPIILDTEVKSRFINIVKYFSFLKYEKIFNLNIKYYPQTNKIIDIKNEVANEENNICLFLNKNNGHMKFIGMNGIPSEENRCVLFPSKMEYFQSTSTDPQGRYIINMSYI